jgi:molecular chaperone GrpE
VPSPFRSTSLSIALIARRPLQRLESIVSDTPPVQNEGPSPPSVEGAKPTSPEEGEDWETKFKYLLADFENFRRRAEREREVAGRHARGSLLRELLPIMEAFRWARDAVARLPPSDAVRRGFDLLDREWMTFLKHEGVEPVVEVGRPFQASEAEAVGEVPTRPELPEGTVAEVVQQGYRFFGGLLRPAKVIVVRRPASPAPEAEAASAEEADPEDAP